MVGTYAYVNPVVAVVLGWLVLHEPITGRMLAAMALILGAVLWIQLAARPGAATAKRPRARCSAGIRRTHDEHRRDSTARGIPRRRSRTSSRGSRTARYRRAEWTHRAHLTVALWYATHHEAGEALDRMRAGILRLNRRTACPPRRRAGTTRPSPASTCTWSRATWRAKAARATGPSAPTGLVARYGDRELPLRHYSEGRLKSLEARAAWVEPDLEPLGW